MSNPYGWATGPEACERWRERLMRELEAAPAGLAAWRRLEAAGITLGALQCLLSYAAGAKGVEDFVDGKRRAVPAHKAAARAKRVAAQRANDPRGALFQSRAAEAERASLDRADTLAASLPTEARASEVARAADGVRRHGPMMFLAVLLFGARAHGVEIGPGALAALGTAAWNAANCGGVCPLDRTNVRRFLTEPDIAIAEPGYVVQFELFNKPPGTNTPAGFEPVFGPAVSFGPWVPIAPGRRG